MIQLKAFMLLPDLMDLALKQTHSPLSSVQTRPCAADMRQFTAKEFQAKTEERTEILELRSCVICVQYSVVPILHGAYQIRSGCSLGGSRGVEIGLCLPEKHPDAMQLVDGDPQATVSLGGCSVGPIPLLDEAISLLHQLIWGGSNAGRLISLM
ncbi:uncharacterized protein IUM83_07321 [Phytophthora cinnamomi]|uniref:uncharacterized protein n=1 Tax=Phytophthora cinnamomi TaxID=4785 RepID=UPI003559B110|nr:hypothetical protein IUM83_07321 [Phytophthora cinnamomi]